MKKKRLFIVIAGRNFAKKRKKAPFFIKKNDYKGMKIEINCTGSDTIQLHELTEFQGELKERSAGDIEKIIKSIKKHGFSFPFFVWKNDGKNNVLDGHGRLLALKQMAAAGEEIPALPCVYISAKNEAEAKEKLLKLNSQYGHMTADSVAAFLGDIKIDFDELALPDGVLDLGKLEPEETKDDDEAPAVDEDGEPDSQPGEMYELGNSILLCGDSTNPEDVARLMGGEKADMVFTDPPYGIDYSGGRTQVIQKKDYGKIMNDTLQGEDLGNLICNVFKFNKGGADVYICCSPIMQKPFLDYLEKECKELNAVIVWDKKTAGLGYMAYRRQCEFILFIKGTPFHKGDKTDFDLWSIARDNAQSYVHGTQKPVAVPARAITNSSKVDDLVLDFFGGSGSTLIAAEKLGRRARIMELDPKYCDVIRKRWTKWAKENGRKVGSGGLE